MKLILPGHMTGCTKSLMGTRCACVYLDVEVDQLKQENGKISVDQLSLVARDAEAWHGTFPNWYAKIAGVPWTVEEIPIAHELIVTWIRDFIEDEEGWHTWVNRGKPKTGGDKHLPTGEDLELVVLQANRQDGSKFSIHVVCPSLIFHKGALGLKGFVCDLAVYFVSRMFKELGNDRCVEDLLPQ